MEVRVDGELPAGVTAKDMILGIIGQIGIGGGTGHVIEYTGSAIRGLSMEGRMTVCNMSIEGGARAGHDRSRRDHLRLPRRPAARAAGRRVGAGASTPGASCPPIAGATYDRTVEIDAASLVPHVTWGTNPGMVAPVTGRVPDPPTRAREDDRQSLERALATWTCSRVHADRGHHRSTASSSARAPMPASKTCAPPPQVVRGKHVAPAACGRWSCPARTRSRSQAEQEGLDRVFTDAGFEWREAGCSMCLGMNPDILQPGERCASTSNRNFEGRQGKGGRTHLVSPPMAAAAAVAGHFVDIRDWEMPEHGALHPAHGPGRRRSTASTSTPTRSSPSSSSRASRAPASTQGLFFDWRFCRRHRRIPTSC